MRIWHEYTYVHSKNQVKLKALSEKNNDQNTKQNCIDIGPAKRILWICDGNKIGENLSTAHDHKLTENVENG